MTAEALANLERARVAIKSPVYGCVLSRAGSPASTSPSFITLSSNARSSSSSVIVSNLPGEPFCISIAQRTASTTLLLYEAMIERNAGLPPERRIEFRVGIHLGDVVEESDGDLMGDSVNIAARSKLPPSRGSSLFAKTIATALDRTSLSQVILDGFFARTALDDLPRETRRSLHILQAAREEAGQMLADHRIGCVGQAEFLHPVRQTRRAGRISGRRVS